MGVREIVVLNGGDSAPDMTETYPLTETLVYAGDASVVPDSTSGMPCQVRTGVSLGLGSRQNTSTDKLKYEPCSTRSPAPSANTSWSSPDRLLFLSDSMSSGHDLSSSLPDLSIEMNSIRRLSNSPTSIKLGSSLTAIVRDDSVLLLGDRKTAAGKHPEIATSSTNGDRPFPSVGLTNSCPSPVGARNAPCDAHRAPPSVERFPCADADCAASDRLHTSEATDDDPCDRTLTVSSTSYDSSTLLARQTDAASLSSVSSLGTGSAGDDFVDATDFVDISLHCGGAGGAGGAISSNTFERSKTLGSEDSGFDERQLHQFDPNPKPVGRRRGITSFLPRGIFSRKAKPGSDRGDDASSTAGWRLFGKVPLPPSLRPPPPAAADDDSAAGHRAALPARPTEATCRRDVEAASTTALILERRPMGLPSKDPEEELRHQLEYEAMIDASKRKEARDMKERKKQLEHQLRHEDKLSAAVKTWNTQILPNWETARATKRVREMWWQGIPPSVRGHVWRLAIGNELNLTPELYEICLVRAKDRLKLLRENAGDTDSISSVESGVSKESSVELIKLDVSRTFPQLCIFQKLGPYHDLLQALLGAYVCYRPDVGYVQGMSFIAAVLLLNMSVADAFICFANLLNRPCTITFFRLDETLMLSYFYAYEEFFEANLPRLFTHFSQQQLTPDLYVIDWLFTLYARALPLDVASRVWDVFCRDGEEFLFRTALGILKLYEDVLLGMDFIHLAQFLTRLPDTICPNALFAAIDVVRMSTEKKRFQQVLHECRERDG